MKDTWMTTSGFSVEKWKQLMALPPDPQRPIISGSGVMPRETFNCPDCSATIREEARAGHAEWHDMLHDAMKEQIEEAIAVMRDEVRDEILETISQRYVKDSDESMQAIIEQLDDISRSLYPPPVKSPWVSGQSKGIPGGGGLGFGKKKYSVLGKCGHGYDLDREFCPHGCKV